MFSGTKLEWEMGFVTRQLGNASKLATRQTGNVDEVNRNHTSVAVIFTRIPLYDNHYNSNKTLFIYNNLHLANCLCRITMKITNV